MKKTSSSSTNRAQAYYRLTKPGIIRGNLITAAAGYFLGSQMHVDWSVLCGLLAGTSLVIAGSCVFNNYLDRDIDKKMKRTQQRELVTGTISGAAALIYASLLSVVGFILLALLTNWRTVAAGAAGIVLYVIAYGASKRRTKYSTIIGSLSGAVPPLAGYLAATNRFDGGAALVFATLAVWQMPHFYAIAMYRREEYAAASLPIWSVVLGLGSTKRQIIGFIVLFAAIAPLLAVFGYAGVVYGVGAAILGLGWLYLGLKGYRNPDEIRWAKRMFVWSLLVITIWSLLIPVDGLIALR